MLKPVLGSQIQLGHPLAKGLVGCWLFNDNPPLLGTTLDLSPYRNDGDLFGDMTPAVAKFSSGLYGDGVGDYVQVPRSDSLEGLSQITILIWVKLASGASNFDQLVNKSRWIADSRSYELFLTATQFRWRLSNPTQSALDEYTELIAGSWTTDVWTCVFATYDGSNMYLYQDGALQGSTPQTGVIADSTYPLYFFRYSVGSDREPPGTIDHVAMWNRALSAQEVQQLYREPFCMFEYEAIELWSAAMGGAPEALEIYVYDTE